MQEQHELDLQSEQDDFTDDVRDELTIDDGTLADPNAGIDAHAAYGSPLEDTNLWVLVAFVLVLGLLFWQGVHKRVKSSLDERAAGIRSQLDEARELREEAQALLAHYQKQQREAEDEAKAIIDQAKADAKIMTREARAQIDEQLARRTKAAQERISRAEAQAVADMRGQTADLAVAAARRIIADRVDARAQEALIDRAIGEVGTRLN
ncbi:F0F1 ATP synthase subunit B [Parvularcula oceani]|uniref:F0F1 ATP synthase subunit B n=1 Tax=Parvularcula oceani TaxID=1247963 RepID=UPI000690C35A|nr:F0F1 ATP synthase subunit B [Parvularcula oceani]